VGGLLGTLRLHIQYELYKIRFSHEYVSFFSNVVVSTVVESSRVLSYTLSYRRRPPSQSNLGCMPILYDDVLY
jgi:hypothetical protein